MRDQGRCFERLDSPARAPCVLKDLRFALDFGENKTSDLGRIIGRFFPERGVSGDSRAEPFSIMAAQAIPALGRSRESGGDGAPVPLVTFDDEIRHLCQRFRRKRRAPKFESDGVIHIRWDKACDRGVMSGETELEVTFMGIVFARRLENPKIALSGMELQLQRGIKKKGNRVFDLCQESRRRDPAGGLGRG